MTPITSRQEKRIYIAESILKNGPMRLVDIKKISRSGSRSGGCAEKMLNYMIADGQLIRSIGAKELATYSLTAEMLEYIQDHLKKKMGRYSSSEIVKPPYRPETKTWSGKYNISASGNRPGTEPHSLGSISMSSRVPFTRGEE